MSTKSIHLIAATQQKKVPGVVPGTIDYETVEVLAPKFVLATNDQHARALAAQEIDPSKFPMDEVTIFVRQQW